MSVKKTVNFLILRPVFNQKNFTSIGFVALAFGLYSLAGGGVPTTPPSLKSGETFGEIDDGTKRTLADIGVGAGAADASLTEPVDSRVDRVQAESIIGIKPSEDASQRERQINRRGRLFDPDTDDSGEGRERLDKDGLVKGVDTRSHRDEWIMLRSEKRKQDTLAAIEDRLDVRRSRKKQPPVSTGDPQ